MSVRETIPDLSALSKVNCVAVLPFENISGRDGAGKSLAQLVADELVVSDKFTILEPTELGRLLKVQGINLAPLTNAAVGQSYAKALGIQAILVGSVSSYAHEDLSSKTNDEEPVVGFRAKLVEAATGRTLWATTASNYDYQIFFTIPKPIGRIARQTVESALDQLLDSRNGHLASQEVCWRPYRAYVDDQGKATAKVAAVAEVVHLRSSSTPAPSSIPRARQSAQPAAPAQFDAARAKTLSEASRQKSTESEDANAAPEERRVSMEEDSSLDDIARRVSDADLTARQKILQDKLLLGGTFPLDGVVFKGNTTRLHRTAQYVLDDFAVVLERWPKTRVRLDGHVDATSLGVKQKAQSNLRAKVVVNYLTNKHDIPSDRFETEGFGNTKPRQKGRSKQARKANTRIEVTVLP